MRLGGKKYPKLEKNLGWSINYVYVLSSNRNFKLFPLLMWIKKLCFFSIDWTHYVAPAMVSPIHCVAWPFPEHNSLFSLGCEERKNHWKGFSFIKGLKTLKILVSDNVENISRNLHISQLSFSLLICFCHQPFLTAKCVNIFPYPKPKLTVIVWRP